MKNSAKSGKLVFNKRSVNVFVFVLTGFFLAQFMLLNILYTKNPLGGWITPFGNLPTFNILIFCLLALFLCLAFLWCSLSLDDKTYRNTYQDQEMLLVFENT